MLWPKKQIPFRTTWKRKKLALRYTSAHVFYLAQCGTEKGLDSNGKKVRYEWTNINSNNIKNGIYTLSILSSYIQVIFYVYFQTGIKTKKKRIKTMVENDVNCRHVLVYI